MITKSVFNLLSTNSPVSAVVVARIYPMVLPQNHIFPAIVYSVVDKEKGVNFDSSSEKFTETFVQVDSITESYQTMKELSLKVFNALNNFSGTNSGNVIYSISQESYSEIYEDALEAYRASNVFKINHIED